MPITQAELKWFKSSVVTDTVSNGGVMSDTVIPSGLKNNIFPDVSQLERDNGLVRYRKLFAKVANDAEILLSNCKIHMKTPTPGNDAVSFIPGTQTDTGTPTGTKYGVGSLDADILAAATELVVSVEDDTDDVFTHGSTTATIYITNGTEEEYHRNVTVSQVGFLVTLTLTDQILNPYLAAETTVALVYEPGEVKCTNDNLAIVTAVNGSILIDAIVGDNIGTVEDTWTFLFTSDVAFDCAGTRLGATGAGNINSQFAPNNPATGKPYFTIEAGSFTGVFGAGDTVVVRTHPAAVPMWLEQIVPAGTDSYSGDNFTYRFGGESA